MSVIISSPLCVLAKYIAVPSTMLIFLLILSINQVICILTIFDVVKLKFSPTKVVVDHKKQVLLMLLDQLMCQNCIFCFTQCVFLI